MRVKDVIALLANRDPEEEIALSGWWYKSDVENNNDIELTDDQWDAIAQGHEGGIERHIDEIVEEVLAQEAYAASLKFPIGTCAKCLSDFPVGDLTNEMICPICLVED
jgi:hypothetical protein